MSSGAPWLELVITHYAQHFRDKFDVLVAFVHWCYVGEGFVCVGSPSPEMEMTPTRVAALMRDSGGGSELLPNGWNSNAETWSLAYKLPSASSSSSSSAAAAVILLKAVRIDGELTLNVVKPESDDVASLTLTPSDHVEDDLTLKASRLFKNAAELRKRVMAEIVARFAPPKPASASDPRRADSSDRFRTDPESYDPNQDRTSSSLREPRTADPLRDYGRADLDPFSGGAGGMHFDPSGGVGGGRGGTPFGPDGRPLPPGAVPPGARFDPFTPFGPAGPGRGRGRGRGFGPDPDHERPPGWDDMFM